MELSQYSVLEVGEYVSAPYAGQLLAGVGADVIKIERPAGDVSRQVGPFIDDVPRLEESAFFGYLNAGKRSVTLDLESATAEAVIHDLIDEYDVDLVVENCLTEYGIDPRGLADRHDGLVVVSATGFGLEGPWQEYETPEIVSAAESGQMNKMGYPDRPPTRLRIKALEYIGGMYAVIGGLSALFHRDANDGSGQHVDVSNREAGSSSMEYYLTGYSWSGHTSNRQGDSYANQGSEQGLRNLYAAADGYISTVPPDLELLVNDILEQPDYLADDPISLDEEADINDDALHEAIEKCTSQVGKWELFEQLQEHGHPVAITATPEDIVGMDHLEARNFWKAVELPDGDTVTLPGFPFRLDGDTMDLGPIPGLGEHDDEIFDALDYDVGLLGSTRDTAAQEDASTSPPPSERTEPKPLEGIKIIDFTWFGAGPQATKILAGLGADVVKVETETAPDGTRMARGYDFDPLENFNVSAWFADFSQGKRSIQLNINTDRGKEIARELIAEADVLAENYGPGFMERVGLEYEDVTAINPEIVYLSMPGWGDEGPLAGYRSFGNTLQSMAGLDHISGFPGDPPTSSGQAWPDPVAGTMAAVAILVGLAGNEATDDSVYIEEPQFELTLTVMHKALSDYLLHERDPDRVGNRDEDERFLQGAYRCRGDDRWAVVAIETDRQWDAFCEVADRPKLVDDARFESQYARLSHHDEADDVIEQWTQERSREEVRTRLQDRGIPAGIVADERDLLDYDPQLRARDYILEKDHPEVGEQRYAGLPLRMSKSAVRIDRAPPCLGEHTSEVLDEWIDFDTDEIEPLQDEGVLH